jgi:hypothetical protein
MYSEGKDKEGLRVKKKRLLSFVGHFPKLKTHKRTTQRTEEAKKFGVPPHLLQRNL